MTGTAAAVAVQVPELSLDGAPLADAVFDSLLDLRVYRSMSAAAMARVVFEDATFTLLDADTFKIGGALVVDMPTTANVMVTAFTGEIVAIGVEQGIGGRHELVVTALDRAHRLSGAAVPITYLNQKVSDVVSAVATRNGLSCTATATGAAEPYLLQTGTDHAFLSELAASVGYEWFVEGTVLTFRPRPATAGVTLTFGEDLRRFQARYSGADAAVSGLTVLGWDPAQQAAVSGTASSVLGSPSASDLGSDAPFVKDAHTKAKSTFGKELKVGSHSVQTAAEAEVLASALARNLLGDAVTARGEAIGTPNLVPGTLVTVDRMGARLSGKYYVTDCEHVFGVGQPLITRFSVAGRLPSTLYAAVGARAAGGPASGPWGTTGVVIGVVTNVADDKGEGRVKVKFPTLGDAIESTWARLVLPGAGPTRGVDIRPEVNDEVVVAFDRGDPRQAYVLGGLWSTKNKPAVADTVADGKVAKRTITSRLGHRIALVDGTADTDKCVEISLADGKTKLRVGQDAIDITANANKPITVTSGSTSIAIAANGDLTVKGVNVTLEGTAKLTLKAPQIEVKGQAAVKIESAGQLEAKGAMVTVEGSGVTQVKGSLLKLN